jgi:hypothetical protein
MGWCGLGPFCSGYGPHVVRVPVTTIWRVLSFRMEDMEATCECIE